MPSYDLARTGIVSGVKQAVPGKPEYFWGNLNTDVPPTRMQVQTVALSGTTATVGVLVIEGQIPVTGQLVSISAASPSYFNVTGAKITAVSAAAVPDVGVFTIQFTLANANIGTTASTGYAVAPQVETSEALTANASVPVSLQSAAATQPANGRAVRFDVSFPTLPGAAIIYAQSADVDVGTEYVNLGAIASVTGGVLAGTTSGNNVVSTVFNGVTANFVRVNNTGLAAAGSAKIISKVLV